MDNDFIENTKREVIEKLQYLSPYSNIVERSNVLAQIQNLLKIEPDNIQYLEFKALYFELTGNYQGAIDYYNKILSIDPDNTSAKNAIYDCKNILQTSNSIKDGTHSTEPKDLQQTYGLEIPDFLKKDEVFEEENRGRNFNNLDNNRSFSNNLENKNGLLKWFPAILVVLAICLICYFQTNKSENIQKEVTNTQIHEQLEEVNPNFSLSNIDENGFVELGVNQPTEYDYLTKQQVYDRRISYVKNTPFYNSKYQPNEEVFGQIVDSKPWWGLINCLDMDYRENGEKNILGVSKVSILINNPMLLVGIVLPYIPYETEYNTAYCSSELAKLVPSSIKISKEQNLIETTYLYTDELLSERIHLNGQPVQLMMELTGVNARDFGYEYIYANETQNIKPYLENSNNFMSDYQKFKDFIHLGSSCQHPKGCNNVSPAQENLGFQITQLPAQIDLKLWKNPPNNKNDKPDLIYRLKFVTP